MGGKKQNTKSNTIVATPLNSDNEPTSKNTKVTTIVAFVTAVCGITFGIYGMAQNDKLKMENQELIDYIANYAEEYNDIIGSYHNGIEDSEEDVKDETNEASEWLEELYTQATGDTNYGMYHEVSSGSTDMNYKPSYLTTTARGRSYRGDLLLIESKEDTINDIYSKISNEMTKQNFSKVDGFLKYSESGYDFDGLGYISKEKDIICSDLKIQDMSKNPGGSPYSGYTSRLMISCGKYSELVPQEGSYEAKAINELSSIFKDKMGRYPDFINTTGQIIRIYGDTIIYELDYGRVGSMLGAFFYRSFSKEDGAEWTGWKFAGLSCSDLQTEEEQKLFTCDDYYGVPVIRGAF